MASLDSARTKFGRPHSVISITGVGHSGYLVLTRKSGKLKIRKTKAKLWFVFDVPTCKLMYSRSPQEAVGQPTPENSLEIVGATLMFGPEKNQFIVSAQGTEFHLTADTYNCMMKWLKVLQECRDQHRKQLEQLEIEMGEAVAEKSTSFVENLIPGVMLGDDSDSEENAANEDDVIDRPSGRLARQQSPPDTEEKPDKTGLAIDVKHASVVLDPQEFLSEMMHHRQSQSAASPLKKLPSIPDVACETAQNEEAVASNGEKSTTSQYVTHGATDQVPDMVNHPSKTTDWEPPATMATSTRRSSDSFAIPGSEEPTAENTVLPASDSTDGDIPMMLLARTTHGNHGNTVTEAPRSLPDEGLFLEDNGTLRGQEAGNHDLEESLQSFHSGYTLWGHFDCRKSEIGRNDLADDDDDEDDDSEKRKLATEKEKSKAAKDSRQVRSLKTSLSQLESDLRMALNQIALLEGRELAYKEKLSHYEGDNSKPDGLPLVKKQRSLRRIRSSTNAPNIAKVASQQQEIEDWKMAADRYHEQNIVMTKEVVQLVEARQDEQRRSQVYKLQCKHLSQDMLRLKISYVEVLQESYPIRLKSAPGDSWDDDQRIDPLEAKNQERVYTQLADCHRYDKRVPIYNRSILGGRHTEKFGFAHTWDEYNVDMHYYLCDLLKRFYQRNLPESVHTRQEANWNGFLADNLWDMTKVSQRSNELKSLIINGIPAKQRPGVWKSLIAMRLKKYRDSKGANYYQSLQGYQNCHSRQIQVDLHRTLTSHVEFVRGSSAIAKLQRILFAYSIHNPHVGYCQGMNMLVAFGLLVLRDEEEVFWLLVALIERYLPEHYFDQDLVGAQADQLLMKELLEDKLPSLAQHLDSFGIDVAMVTFNWCLTVFVDAVPTDTLLRIWDCLLFEGNRVLFRFSLAILQSHAPRLQRIHDPITLFQHLKLMAKLAYDEEELTKIAYISLHPFASRKHMGIRREHYVSIKKAVIDEDDAARYKQRREQAPAAFKSSFQRAASRPTDASKRMTSWECTALESDDLVWLCEGDREAGYVSVLRLSTSQAALVECDLQSRIMSICKLQSRHILLGTLLGTLTAFLSSTGCELYTVQLKDSVLSLVATESGKTFAGLADGTLVVFEKFSAQAISREVTIQSGVSLTSLLLVDLKDFAGQTNLASVSTETLQTDGITDTDGKTPTQTVDAMALDDDATPRPTRKEVPFDAETEDQADGGGDVSGDVPDCIGKIPPHALLYEKRKHQGNAEMSATFAEKTPTEKKSGSEDGQLSSGSSLGRNGPTLWCGCGNNLLVLDTDTLEEVKSIRLSSNLRNNIGHLRLTRHGVWTVMHRTATIDLWDPISFRRLMSVDCDSLLKESLAVQNVHTIPPFQRATAFAIGEQAVWLGTQNGFLIISKLIDVSNKADTSPCDAAGGDGFHGSKDGSDSTGKEGEHVHDCQRYKLKLLSVHHVSEDALRVLMVAKVKDEEVAVVCPQHTAPQLWKFTSSTESENGGLWTSHPVDCDSSTIEDILHIERSLPLLEELVDKKSSKFVQSVDFLAEAEMIDPDEIVIKAASVDDLIDQDAVVG